MNSRYERSLAAHARARKTLAGGVSSSVRLSDKPVPLYFDRGEGAYLYDIDGNRYIDYVLGRGPLILGHGHPAVLDSVIKQLKKGQIYAAQHELEYELSERIVSLVPSMEMVRFGISGSEAVHGVLRLARAYTGRKIVIKFEGQYHGWLDNILYSLSPDPVRAGDPLAPSALAESPGQFSAEDQHVVVLPWNNLEVLAAFLDRFGDQVAAIITEPVMCNTAVIPPLPGYLDGVRSLATQHGAVLIFDEVITGFRLSIAGAQGLFGIKPDLSIFAKAVANGQPLSCFGGKAEIMELISAGKVGHGGTFNSIPPAVAGAVAALDVLAGDKGATYRQLEKVGGLLMTGIREITSRLGLPVVVQGYPSIFYVGFPTKLLSEAQYVVDYRSSLNVNHDLYNRVVCALVERGVRVIPRGNWFLCSALSELDVAETLRVVEEAFVAEAVPQMAGGGRVA